MWHMSSESAIPKIYMICYTPSPTQPYSWDHISTIQLLQLSAMMEICQNLYDRNLQRQSLFAQRGRKKSQKNAGDCSNILRLGTWLRTIWNVANIRRPPVRMFDRSSSCSLKAVWVRGICFVATPFLRQSVAQSNDSLTKRCSSDRSSPYNLSARFVSAQSPLGSDSVTKS